MKKIVTGKMYNTETAKKLASDGYSNSRDFFYWYEELYLTKNGLFFLCGEGGPNSRYQKQIGSNEYSGSCEIIPLTREEAFEWCQTADETSVIENYFLDMVEEA